MHSFKATAHKGLRFCLIFLMPLLLLFLAGVASAEPEALEYDPIVVAYLSKYGLDADEINRLMGQSYTEEDYARFIGAHPARGNAVEGAFNRTVQRIARQDRNLGVAVSARLMNDFPPIEDTAQSREIALLGRALLEKTPMAGEPFIFGVLSSPVPMSFSAPGGFVYLTTGALKAALTQDQLAGLLAHEIVHSVERHGVPRDSFIGKQIDKLARMQKYGKRDLGESNEKKIAELEEKWFYYQADSLYAEILKGRSAADESAADAVAILIAYNAGFEAGGLADYLEAIAQTPAAKSSSMEAFGLTDRGHRS